MAIIEDDSILMEENELQVREFLSRTEIKTMRKDLQKLRESQALKERDRIVNMDVPIAKPQPVEDKKEAEEKTRKQDEAIQKMAEEEAQIMKEIKTYANEEEKQQIFYLETEKSEIDKKLTAIKNDQQPPFLLDKNKLMLERNDIEEGLKKIVEEENQIEGLEKTIEESEKSTNNPKDKQKLEQKRWDLEAKRTPIEKKRWEIERDLEKVNSKLKEMDQGYQVVTEEEKVFRTKAEEINASLRQIHVTIMKREEEKKRIEAEQKLAGLDKKAEEEAERKEAIRRQEWAGKDNVGLSGVPAKPETKSEFIKKVETGLSKEEEERRRFLENIDKWAEEEKQ